MKEPGVFDNGPIPVFTSNHACWSEGEEGAHLAPFIEEYMQRFRAVSEAIA